jgi:3-oxoacyl-[acyl-carrier protein] reductase
MDLSGKTAIVTGAGQGLGYGISSELMRRGANVVVFELEDGLAESAAESLTAEAAAGPRAIPFAGSVISASDVAAAFDAADGPVELLVNNAGVIVWGLITEMDEQAWDRAFDIFAKAPFLLSAEFARRAEAGGTSGAIVNISTLNAEMPSEGSGAYCASKAAVSQLTKVCALEFAPLGIRVNAVAPGPILTRHIAPEKEGDTDIYREWLARSPLGRLGEPLDVALATAFLLSDDARWITGASVPLDGGMHARGLHNYHAMALAAEKE